MYSDLTCPITQELFEYPINVPCCGRVFEATALQQHTEYNNNCPMCRADFSDFNFDPYTAPKNTNIAGIIEEMGKNNSDGNNKEVNKTKDSWKASLSTNELSAKLSLTLNTTEVFAPRLVILVLDASGSMFNRPWEQVNNVAMDYCKSHNGFGTILKVVVYGSNYRIFDKDEFLNRDRPNDCYGGTSYTAAINGIYRCIDSCKDAINGVDIIFMSDGCPNESLAELDKYWKAVIPKMDIVLHYMGFGSINEELSSKMITWGSSVGILRYVKMDEDVEELYRKMYSIIKDIKDIEKKFKCIIDGDGWTLAPGQSEERTLTFSNNVGTADIWLCYTDSYNPLNFSVDLEGKITSIPLEKIDKNNSDKTSEEDYIEYLLEEEKRKIFAANEESDEIRKFQYDLSKKKLQLLRSNNENIRSFLRFIDDNRENKLSKASALEMKNSTLDKHTKNLKKKKLETENTRPKKYIKESSMICKKFEYHRYKLDLPPMIFEITHTHNKITENLEKMFSDTTKDYLNEVDEHGNSPLHWAAYLGSLKIVKRLLEMKNVNVNLRNKNDETPLTMAIKYHGFWKTVNVLVENNATLPKEELDALYSEARRYYYVNTMVAISKITPQDLTYNTPTAVLESSFSTFVDDPEFVEILTRRNLWDLAGKALSYRHSLTDVISAFPKKADDPLAEEYVKLLTHYSKFSKEDVMDSGDTILHAAVENGNLPLVELFLKNSPECIDAKNNLGNTPLWVACAKRFPCIASYLLENGASPDLPNHKGNPPLSALLQRGPLKMVELLISIGVSPDFINKNGDTAPILACRNKQPQILEYLLNYVSEEIITHRAKIDGYNILFAAVEAGCIECVKIAMKHIPLTDKTDDDNEIIPGATVLHVAAIHNSPIITSLIDLGCVPESTDIYGMTPLHTAIIKNNVECAKSLIPLTDTTIKDNNGRTAYYYASPEMKKLLSSEYDEFMKTLPMSSTDDILKIVERNFIPKVFEVKDVISSEVLLSWIRRGFNPKWFVDFGYPIDDGHIPLRFWIIFHKFKIPHSERTKEIFEELNKYKKGMANTYLLFPPHKVKQSSLPTDVIFWSHTQYESKKEENINVLSLKNLAGEDIIDVIKLKVVEILANGNIYRHTPLELAILLLYTVSAPNPLWKGFSKTLESAILKLPKTSDEVYINIDKNKFEKGKVVDGGFHIAKTNWDLGKDLCIVCDSHPLGSYSLVDGLAITTPGKYLVEELYISNSISLSQKNVRDSTYKYKDKEFGKKSDNILIKLKKI